MCDQDADAGKVSLAKQPPQAFVEATHPIISVCRTLAVWYTVEKVSIVGALLPHALHLGRAWLKVAKVLFAQSRFLKDLDLATRKGRGSRGVGSQGAKDAFGGLTSATVWRGEELERVVGFEHRPQTAAGVLCLLEGLVARCDCWRIACGEADLLPSIWGELHAVVWYKLVYVAVLVTLALGVTYQNDHLQGRSGLVHRKFCSGRKRCGRDGICSPVAFPWWLECGVRGDGECVGETRGGRSRSPKRLLGCRQLSMR